MLRIIKRIPWVDVLIVILVSALMIGGIAAITKAAKEDKKTISSTEFKRGALDANGLYVESDTSIYTKDLIECVGLEIEPDFEVSGDYQVFYYGTDKSFIGASALMDAQTDGVYIKGNEYPLAKYCRIVISPAAPEDEDGDVEEDWKIKFYEVAGFADDYTIRVDKKQKIDYSKIDLLEGQRIYEGFCNTIHDDYLEGGNPDENYFCTSAINVAGFNKLKIVVPAGSYVDIIFYDKSGTNLCRSNPLQFSTISSDIDVEEVFDIMPGAVFVALNYHIAPPITSSVSDYHLYFVE